MPPLSELSDEQIKTFGILYDKTFETQTIVDITSDNVIIHDGNITETLVKSILIQTGIFLNFSKFHN